MNVVEIVAYSAAAGACIPLGGLLASIEHLHPRWLQNEFRHFMIAFGGGVLLAAVALVLLPQGVAFVSEPLAIATYFVLGGLTFFALERALGHRRRESPQFLATLLDYAPESLALGGVFAAGVPGAPLLAVLIGLQNLPEGFNAYRELMSVKGAHSRRTLLGMSMLIPIGPILATLGWVFLSTRAHLLGAIMIFASGGLLYLVFQDIAPQSRLEHHWFPPLGAVFGFGAGLMGQLLIGGA